MNRISVTFEDGRSLECDVGTAVCSLLQSRLAESGLPYIAALVNNDAASLSYPLTVDSKVGFLTAADPHGWRIYRRSLSFLLAKTVHELYPDAHFTIEHSFGQGLYCTFTRGDDSTAGISARELASVDRQMRATVTRDVAIERRKIAYTAAVREFEESGQLQKLNLLRHRNPPRVVLHWCDGFSDLAHGPLVPSTGVLNRFKLLHYPPGLVLQVPERNERLDIPDFVDQPHLFHIFQEHKHWGRILGVNTVGRLNEIIADHGLQQFIMIAEALHEKKCAQIADQIASRRGDLRMILMAGPSSAGKTTFAKKLTNHLRVNGIQPVTVATDNYFVGPKQTPRDESGELDFEHVEAVDLELFNADMVKLINGRQVELPHFNFETKSREYHGHTLKIDNNHVVIIEGIHGLNPRLTEMVPAHRKFKVYINALTQLSVDFNNRISTTDNRLMRRMVRDHKYRGHSALETLRRWPSVRRGEKRWIFPFQRGADATFNSALDYELAILKPLVEPLLMQIKPSDPEYAESRRLTEFLLNFLGAPFELVPSSSILREYIGGSMFTY